MQYNSKLRDSFVYASSLWEMTLQCNVVSHWLGASTKWSLETKAIFDHDDAQIKGHGPDYSIHNIDGNH